MPPWLAVWIARWGLGERFRKATPHDYRYWIGALCLFPVFMITGATVFDRAGNLASVYLWLVATALMVVYFVALNAWARLVKPIVSGLLAVGTWAVLFLWLTH